MRFRLFLEQDPMGGMGGPPPMGGDPLGGGMGGPPMGGPPMGGDPMMGGMGGPPMGGDPMMGGMGGPPAGNQNPSLPKETDVWSVVSSILKKHKISPSLKPKKTLDSSSHLMN